MSQAFVKNYLHLVFSTKHRTPLIRAPFDQALHAYLGTVCNNMGCHAVTIGGYTDHVHMLCLVSQKIPLMKLLQDVKSNSSRWMKTKDASLRNFSWQDGYGAFSVNPLEIDAVIKYITGQHDHHQKITFQDEYRAFLIRYKIEFNEKYLWD